MDVAMRHARRLSGLAALEGAIRRGERTPSAEDADVLEWLRGHVLGVAGAWRLGWDAWIGGRRVAPPDCYRRIS